MTRGKFNKQEQITFFFSKDHDEERAMHWKSDNLEIMINIEADEIIKYLFDSIRSSYQNNLGLIKGSGFVFDNIYLLYYKCHKKNPFHRGSYIGSPDTIKSKKATINLINK